MLTQYSLTLRGDPASRPRPDWAYRLYAELLYAAPPDFATAIHQNAITPVSHYLLCGPAECLWRVSLLGEPAEAALGPVLESKREYRLRRDNAAFQVAGWQKRTFDRAESLLFFEDAGTFELSFVTPTAFKSRGQYLNLPTSRLIVQSLIKKWNGCFLDCPIEDEDGEGMEALAAGLVCRSFRLHDQSYRLKGLTINGFVGDMTLENHLQGFHRQLANALLFFAGQAGVGIKTALGMGGVVVNAAL